MFDNQHDPVTGNPYDHRFYDHHVARTGGGGVLGMVLFIFSLWFLALGFLWGRSRILGLLFIAFTFGGMEALRYGLIRTPTDIERAKSLELPRCYKTDTCDFMSGVPLRDQ